MKDKAGLRKHFADQANQSKDDGLFRARSAQLSSMEDTLIDGFNELFKFLAGKVTKTEVVNQLKGFATTEDIENIVNSISKLDKSTLSNKIDLKPIVEAINSVKDEVAHSVGQIEIEKTEEVKVNNLDEIKFDTSAIEKAIKALKLDVKVDGPKINIEKPDLQPIQDIMLDLLKAFNKQKQALQDGGSVKISNIKDVPLADLSKVEKKLDESNKQLKVIAEKRFGGGSSGGGNGTPYTDADGKPKNVELEPDGSIPVKISQFVATSVNIATDGAVKTITETDGILTRITTIDSTDPNDKNITIEWS